MAATRNKPAPDAVAGPLERLRRWLRDRLATATALRRVAVGFSGGRDSLALLDALDQVRDEFAISIEAVHVHHGLSPNADAWASFAETFCRQRAIPLSLHRVQVNARGDGVEAAARRARYEVFAQLPVDLLLLAHHSDDQAETLLFNLLRGSGVHGAAGMRDWRWLTRSRGNALPIGRPWLTVRRREIDEYIAARGLAYVDDESNQSTQPSRNFLRHRVLPVLSERHQHSVSALGAAARRFAEAADLLDEVADQDIVSASDGEALRWPVLAALSPARRANVLRRWLALGGVPLGSEAALSEFLRQCGHSAGDRMVAGTFGTLQLYRWRDQLFRVAPTGGSAETRLWQGGEPLVWGGGQLTAVPVMGQGIRRAVWGEHRELRTRVGGERMRVHRDGPLRPLRLLFQEADVPPWLRESWPLIWIDGALAVVPGIGIDAAFQAGADDAGVMINWDVAERR